MRINLLIILLSCSLLLSAQKMIVLSGDNGKLNLLSSGASGKISTLTEEVDTTTYIYSSEASALFSRMAVQPTDERKVAMDTLIIRLKRDTIWSKLDFFYNFAVATEQQALLNWVKDAHNGTNTDMVFHADSGFWGGTNKYINTNYTPSTQAVNQSLLSSSSGIFNWRDIAYTISGLSLGADDGSMSTYIQTGSGSSKYLKISFNSTAGGSTLDIATGKTYGLFCGGRVVSNMVFGRCGSKYVNSAANNVAATLVSRPVYLGARNNNGTADVFSSNTIGLAFMGAGLSSYQYHSLLNHWNKYLITIGKKKVSMCTMGASTISPRNNNGEDCHSIGNLMNDSVPGKKYTIYDIATGGEPMWKQLNRWNALTAQAKGDIEIVFMSLTGNDVVRWKTCKEMADTLNALIAQVASDIGVRNKIAIAPELPIHGYYDNYGPGGIWEQISWDSVALLHSRHDSISACIKGIGAYAIVRPDGGPLIRMGNYVATFTTGDGYLAPIAELPIPDHAHENGYARQVIADEWEQVYLDNR